MYTCDKSSTRHLKRSTAAGWSCSTFTQTSKFHLWSFFLLWEWAQWSASSSPRSLSSGENPLPLSPSGEAHCIHGVPQAGWQPPARQSQRIKTWTRCIGVHTQLLCLSVTDTNQAVWSAWSYVSASGEAKGIFLNGHTSTKGTEEIQRHGWHFVKFTIWLRKGQQRNLSLNPRFRLCKTRARVEPMKKF